MFTRSPGHVYVNVHMLSEMSGRSLSVKVSAACKSNICLETLVAHRAKQAGRSHSNVSAVV